MTSETVDLGSGYSYTKFGWAPDRELNPQYADIPDVPWLGIIVTCGPHQVEGSVFFSINPTVDALPFGDHPRWQVESWEPLTISPSVENTICGCHGFIREGRWVAC